MVADVEPFQLYRNYSKYWHRLWDYRYGNCYTFNGGIDDNGDKQRVLSSHVTGPTGGNTFSCYPLTAKKRVCFSIFISFVVVTALHVFR